jgi:hypothetical protein
MGDAVQYREVLSALGVDREAVLEGFRARGGHPDRWERLRASREAMADALTSVEDRLDLERTSPTVRARQASLRTVRRRLEQELWP